MLSASIGKQNTRFEDAEYEMHAVLRGLGIYGTISFLVNEQSREIAIRFALGAQRREYRLSHRRLAQWHYRNKIAMSNAHRPPMSRM
jgi:hypothetical protein